MVAMVTTLLYWDGIMVNLLLDGELGVGGM